MKVERTTFEVEGMEDPCILVSSEDGFVQVRISKCYHHVGRDSLYVTEFIDSNFNGREEIVGDFDYLTDNDAISIAIDYSAYL